MVHFKRICGCEKAKLYEGRIFNNGSYENRDQWDGAFNVHIQGQAADISMLDKGWSRSANKKMVAFCRSQGVKTLRWERRGKEKTRNL